MRVVIADDSLLVREGIASLLRRAGFEVVAEASTGDKAVELVDAHTPDIAIVDIRMPPTQTDEGLRAARTRSARGVRAVFAKLGLAPGDEAHRRVLAVLTYLSPDGRQ